MKMVKVNLFELFPPSPGCDCDICRGYCKRPGWWTVEQAERALNKGYAHRMMMEISPEFDFAVLSPAFYGCEGYVATNEKAENGCNFLKDGLCELHGSDIYPLECAFCHHKRVGQGIICHTFIAREWKTLKGQKLVASWQMLVGFDRMYKLHY